MLTSRTNVETQGVNRLLVAVNKMVSNDVLLLNIGPTEILIPKLQDDLTVEWSGTLFSLHTKDDPVLSVKLENRN